VSVVLGIDPGLAATGYGVLAVAGNRARHLGDGVIRTAAGADYGSRLVALHDHLHRVVEQFRPDAAALEQMFFSRNVRTAFPVAQARGVAILVLAQRGIPYSEYSPGAVKQALAGHSRADKSQMVNAVRLVLGFDEHPISDHGADALAVALCHVQHAPVRAALARAALALAARTPAGTEA
jgi:crossover junction endodeoxyribonuclease RuvC